MEILIVQNDNGFIERCVEHEFRDIDDEVGEGEELVVGWTWPEGVWLSRLLVSIYHAQYFLPL